MTNNSILIRKATPNDANSIAEAQRQIAKIPGQLASRPEEIKDENIKAKITEMSQSDRGLFVVMEVDEQIVGHALLEPHKLAVTSHVVVLTLVINEGFQGNGFGRRMMNYLVDWAKQNKNVEKFELHVRSANTRAIELYKSLGFVEEGRKTKQIKIGPGNYMDNIYMALWVA